MGKLIHLPKCIRNSESFGVSRLFGSAAEAAEAAEAASADGRHKFCAIDYILLIFRFSVLRIVNA